MRAGLLLSLAWADYRGEARLSLCAIFALAAVITPLLVLFGLKYGLVSTLTERLERAPSVREIIPVGGARYRAEDIAALAARADVAFAVPRTRQIAATADLSGGGETALSVEMISSATGDPLLAGLPQPDRPTRVVLSHGAAEKLGAQPGERIVARIGRRMDGQAQSQRLELEVLAVLPQERFARDALFAPLALLEAAEDYRDGRAVAAYGWPGKAGETPRARIYPGFRLYARDLDAVEGLRRHFVASGVEVATQAEAIAQVRSLSRNLGLVFWIVAALAIGGAFAATRQRQGDVVGQRLGIVRRVAFGPGRRGKCQAGAEGERKNGFLKHRVIPLRLRSAPRASRRWRRPGRCTAAWRAAPSGSGWAAGGRRTRRSGCRTGGSARRPWRRTAARRGTGRRRR